MFNSIKTMFSKNFGSLMKLTFVILKGHPKQLEYKHDIYIKNIINLKIILFGVFETFPTVFQ